MPQFYTLLTDTGQAKVANAVALGTQVEITHMAVGDGGGSPVTPDSSAESLLNEVRRAPINAVQTDPDNPTWITVEQVLPPDVGGWTIREVGVFDAAGDLIAIGNLPETYKPVLSEGSSRTQTIRVVMEVSDTTAVTLKVDPSVVLATREYVDTHLSQHEQDPEAHADDQITISEEISQAPGETNVAGALSALGSFAAASYQNIAVFDTAGVTEWGVPEVLQAGLRKAHVTVVGGGGSGARDDDYAGAGGAAGGAAIGMLDLEGVASVTVTVGAGGAAATAGGAGSLGESSSFGEYMSATGGGSGSGAGNGGIPGIGTGGDLNLGGGGGAASGGENPSSHAFYSGAGGCSIFAGAGRGVGSISGAVGIAGILGAGGSGSCGAKNSGSGGDGIVIVRW